MACELLQESITPEGSLIDEVVEESLVSCFGPVWREGNYYQRVITSPGTGWRFGQAAGLAAIDGCPLQRLVPVRLSTDVLIQRARPGRAVAAPSTVARGGINRCERRGDPTVEVVAAEVLRPMPDCQTSGLGNIPSLHRHLTRDEDRILRDQELVT